MRDKPIDLPERIAGREALLSPYAARYRLEGHVGEVVRRVINQWVLPAPRANPMMLEMFRMRDRQPHQELVPWAGEFAGKYLTHAAQIEQLTRDPNLYEHTAWFVGQLIDLQDPSGYLGPWPAEYRFKTGNPACPEPWDAWGHYHIMTGLLQWYETASDEDALEACARIGDLLCERFLDAQPGRRLHDLGAHEMNAAPAHSLARLYRLIPHDRYLKLAQQLVDEFALEPAGDYLRQGLANTPFHHTPKPRWESLHPIMALVELYHITGEQDHRTAFENLWWSMLEGDRHNTGGFTTGEKATGNPGDKGPIETCSTVAWSAMCVEMLRLTGDSRVADELELTLFNSGLGLLLPAGRGSTYNTPMQGVRQSSAHTIVFQARAGSPELNCCNVNGPRILGLISDWAVMHRERALAINYFGQFALETRSPAGHPMRLQAVTDYPHDHTVHLMIESPTPEQFTLMLRIPYWSRRTSVYVNQEQIEDVTPGQYLELTRVWQGNERISIDLDFRPHYWYHEPIDDQQGLASIYWGPILLAYDPRYNEFERDQFPVIDPATALFDIAHTDLWLSPWLLLETMTPSGQAVRLCDYASAGNTGTRYDTWLPVRLAENARREFSRENPLRSVRAASATPPHA